MYKTHDYIHHYQGCWRSGGMRRIEIFQEESRPPLIICTVLSENDRRIVAVMVECLAAEIALKHFPASFEALGEPFIWIEHHPPSPEMGIPAAYKWVTFDSYAPRLALHVSGMRHVALGPAHWTSIDRAAIEEQIAVSPRPLRAPSAASQSAGIRTAAVHGL